MKNEPTRLVVLISGYGSNLQVLIETIARGELEAEISAVISNKSSAFGLERAKAAGIPAIVKSKSKSQDRQSYDAELADLVSSFQPDWVILAGWMRLLSMSFLSCFPNRVINLHPALPGMFAGVDAIQRAYEAFQQGQITQTGVMVHLVPDEGVDDGPLLNQEIVPIYTQDTLEDLEKRVHTCEHHLLVETIKQLIKNGGFNA
jgi:phosphoribosylglycinamide formyltransferase-1